MAAIPSNFGASGVGLDPFPGAGPSLVTILRDISDDLGAVKGENLPALVAAVPTDLPTCIALLTEIRTKWNALAVSTAAQTLKTSKGP